jgi:hypothetical protein
LLEKVPGGFFSGAGFKRIIHGKFISKRILQNGFTGDLIASSVLAM